MNALTEQQQWINIKDLVNCQLIIVNNYPPDTLPSPVIKSTGRSEGLAGQW